MKTLYEIKENANYCLNCKTKPCTKGCPLGNNIPDFIKCVKEENYKEAYEILQKTTLLPSICGRICPHQKQCQGNCVRGIKGEPVHIGELEAFIGDMAIKENWGIDAEKELVNNLRIDADEGKGTNHNKKVAIVGGGPAGLTCAVFLAKKRVKVTIYEKHEKLGGLLRYGIPEFRLDREILDKQIQKILDLGIEVTCGKELGKDFDINELRDNYNAVFLCFGANVSRKMNIPGEDLNGVFGGNELLEYNLHPDYKGKRVAVIGGGNVAMDVSRTVKRLGAERVYVIYRRAEEQMPAERKEIADAKEEGIEFLFQSNIARINGNSAYHVRSATCVKTELVHREDSDRLAPVDIDGSDFTVDVDYVVMAIGAEAESSVVSKQGIDLNKWGYVDVDDNFMTSLPNVFAGGDLIGSNATVAWAARNGRDVAMNIIKLIK